MHSRTIFQTLALSVAVPMVMAACGETAAKVCFGVDGGQSQDILIEDVQYVADYLRYIGEENSGLNAMWSMPIAGFDCQEWQLPVPAAGSVLPLAKHINPRINSTVLYTDMADTIEKTLLGCGTNGGMVGVTADATNPAYNTDEYKATKAKPEGIIIKLVKAP
ncbi:hypothetical protein F5Y04DRAFT_264927 [Hypomontagnella monticulosa]|nr:hypothetical protein F5Y04DRAFT_264927 [Hypomontagnella monticulosa]